MNSEIFVLKMIAESRQFLGVGLDCFVKAGFVFVQIITEPEETTQRPISSLLQLNCVASSRWQRPADQRNQPIRAAAPA